MPNNILNGFELVDIEEKILLRIAKKPMYNQALMRELDKKSTQNTHGGLRILMACGLIERENKYGRTIFYRITPKGKSYLNEQEKIEKIKNGGGK